jgi:hypothetical protein
MSLSQARYLSVTRAADVLVQHRNRAWIPARTGADAVSVASNAICASSLRVGSPERPMTEKLTSRIPLIEI